MQTIGNLITASFVGELTGLCAVAALAWAPISFAVPFAAGVGLAVTIMSYIRFASTQRDAV